MELKEIRGVDKEGKNNFKETGLFIAKAKERRV